MPSRTFEAATAFCTSEVMSIQSVCPAVRTFKFVRVVIEFELMAKPSECQCRDKEKISIALPVIQIIQELLHCLISNITPFAL